MNIRTAEKIFRFVFALIFILGSMGLPGTTAHAAEAQSLPTYAFPRMYVGLNDHVSAEFWTLGSTLTLTIDSDTIPENGNLYQDSKPVVEPVDDVPELGIVNFKIWQDDPSFDLLPGQYVTISDGTTTKFTWVEDVTFETGANGIASGTGPARQAASVDVQTNTGRYQMDVVIDDFRNWLANFNLEGHWFDYVDRGTVDVWDEDGDSTVAALPFPITFGARPATDTIEGWEWPVHQMVTITVDDPLTGPSPDKTATALAAWVEGQRDRTLFTVVLDGYDLKVGDIVTVTNGTTTKQHTVRNLELTDYDLHAETISGTSDRGQLVYPLVCTDDQCAFREETADENGNWSANFSVPGDKPWEQDLVDVRGGSWANAEVRDNDGDVTQAGMNLPDPNFNVRANVDQVEAFQWAMGDHLVVEIDSPQTSENPDYTVSKNVTGVADWDPSQTYVLFELGDIYDIQVGDTVSISNGSLTKTTLVKNLEIIDVDLDADVVHGVAESNQGFSVWTCHDGPCINRDETADGSGNWSVDFGIPGDQDWEQETTDLRPGSWIDSAVGDEDGDRTMFGWSVPYPTFSVRANFDQIETWEWAVGEILTVSIDSTDADSDPNYTTTGVVPGGAPWDPRPYLSFDLAGIYDIVAGDTVTVSNGSFTKTTIVTNLEFTNINLDSDVVDGIAGPNQLVNIWTCHDGPCVGRDVTADGSGHWSVDFGVPGEQDWEEETVDLQAGAWIDSSVDDDDRDSTMFGWSVPFTRFHAQIVENTVEGYEWPVEADVTLSIDNQVIGTQPVNAYDGNSTVGGVFFGDLQGLQLAPGMSVVMTNGTITKTLLVTDVVVTGLDLEADTVWGTGTPDAQINVQYCNEQGCLWRRWATVQQDRTWSVDFSVTGERDDEQLILDIQPGMFGEAIEPDDDGDHTDYQWGVPNPTFGVRMADNEVHGYSWPLGTPVTLTIDDPNTAEPVDFSETRTVEVADWDPNQTFVAFRVWESAFTLQPGQQIMMTDGVTIKTHTVTNLSVSGTDANADTVTGTAPSGSRIHVWYCHENGCVNRYETAQGGDHIGVIQAAQVADQFIPSIMWGYNDAIEDYGYNPALARSLLAEAGYPDGFTVNLWIRDVPRVYMPHALDTAQAIQGYLSDVGITTNLQVLESDEMIERTWNGEADLYLLGWGVDFDHPDNFYAFHFCSEPDALGISAQDNVLCNQVVAARAETNASTQLSIYEGIAQQIHDTVPLVPLAHVKTASLFRQDINGFVPAWSAFGTASFRNVTSVDNQLTYAVSRAPAGLDPALFIDSTAYMVTTQVMDTLVMTDSGNPIPGLAENWSVSPDGLTWTFTIRSGVTFHDGTPLNAAAVLYNLERWWDPAHPYHDPGFEYFKSIFNGFKGDPNALIVGLELLGNDQIQIRLNEPFSPMPNALAMEAFGIASPAAIQAGTLNTHPVGTGPFAFVNWSEDGTIHLTANAGYWGGTPTLTDLYIKVISDESARYAALESNAVQAMEVQDIGYVLQAEQNPNLQVMWHPEMNVGYLGINQAHGPLGDIRVREAIAHAIDKASLLAEHYNAAAYGNGTWVADFAHPGDEPDEQDTWDLQFGNSGEVAQCDEDGDCTAKNWYVDWIAPPSVPLVVAINSEVDLSVPGATLENIAVLNALHDSLFRLDSNNHLLPLAATDYEVSTDGLVYTVNLRPDAVWSDGQPVTAQHFVDGILRVLDPNAGSDYGFLFYPIANAEDFNKGRITDRSLVGVKALDAWTLEFTLEQRTSHFPQILASPAALPARQDLIDQYGDTWTSPAHYVSNGLYRLVEYDPAHVLVEQNPLYNGPILASFSQIGFDVIPDAAQQVDAYKNGEVDVLLSLPLADIMGDPALRNDLTVLPSPGLYYVGLSTQVAPMDNPLVRRALASAINRQVILDDVLQTSWRVEATGLIPPELPGYQGSAVGYSYDPAQAQAFLAQAGYPNGQGFPVLNFTANPNQAAMMQEVASQWETVLGITVNVHVLPFDERSQILQGCREDPFTCEYEGYVSGWFVDYPDAYNLLNDLFNPESSYNFTQWENPAYLNLIDLAISESNPVQRIAYLQQAEQLLVEDDAAIIPLFHTDYAFVIRPGIFPYYSPTFFSNLAYWSDVDPGGDGMSAEVIGSDGGSISAESDSISVQVPAGALEEDVNLTVTDLGGNYQITATQNELDVIAGFSIQPHGLQFAVPVTLSFAWEDVNNDGVVDGTSKLESNLFLLKDGEQITPVCAVNPNCDSNVNLLTVEVSSLSHFELVAPVNEAPADVVITAPVDPIAITNDVTVNVTFVDVDDNDPHMVRFDWGDGASTTNTIASGTSAMAVHHYTSAGVYTVTAVVSDSAGESAQATFQYIVIYDPDGGFVTGGGWINSPQGAYTANRALTGKATFGFVSKYQRGANVPTGDTEFQFKLADLNFKSTSYEWLVVAGTRAQYKGTGTINGAGTYKFMLTAIDGSPDKFRIKIWDALTGDIIYDNQFGAADTSDPTTAIQGGSIVIHRAR